MHGRTGEFLKRGERLVAHIEAPLGEVEADRLLLAVPPLFTRGSSWVLSLQVVKTLDLHSFAVESDAASADLVHMEVELGEGRLLFHEHHGSLALLHHLELLLLLAHLLLVLELDLVVPLELFLSVASLQIQLKLEVASMRLDDLLLVVTFSLGLGCLQIGQVLSALLGLQLLFLLLLGRLLRLSRLDDDSLGEGHLNGKFEIGRHEQLVHLNFARDVHVVEGDGQVRGAQSVERLLRNHEVVQRQRCEFKFILTDHRVIVQFDELVRNCALIDIWQGQRNSQAELTAGQILCLSVQLLEHLSVLHDE